MIYSQESGWVPFSPCQEQTRSKMKVTHTWRTEEMAGQIRSKWRCNDVLLAGEKKKINTSSMPKLVPPLPVSLALSLWNKEALPTLSTSFLGALDNPLCSLGVFDVCFHNVFSYLWPQFRSSLSSIAIHYLPSSPTLLLFTPWPQSPVRSALLISLHSVTSASRALLYQRIFVDQFDMTEETLRLKLSYFLRLNIDNSILKYKAVAEQMLNVSVTLSPCTFYMWRCIHTYYPSEIKYFDIIGSLCRPNKRKIPAE